MGKLNVVVRKEVVNRLFKGEGIHENAVATLIGMNKPNLK